MAVLVEYTYSPDDLPARDQHRATHRAWLQTQIDAGAVIVAGAYADGTGALIIASGEDADATRELFTNDPFNVEGLVQTANYRVWNPPLGKLG